MKRDGHEVEVHGYQHSFVPLLLPWTAIRQISASAQLLKQKFGLTVRYYRPTWGLSNLAQMYPIIRGSYRLVTWSIMVGDWRVTAKEVLLNRIMPRLHAGAIIVLHDSDETFGAETAAPKQMMDMLPSLIQAVQQQGYKFVTISNATQDKKNMQT
jgi:peptidoglycan/xylan/chitin deacetylase (PgdA/CDA1 family)